MGMLRSMASKVAWVGKTASMVFGLALVVALILGVASVALSATGGNFILGKANEATTVSKLTASIAGPALTLVNQSTDAAATALNINVASGKAPLRVNAAAGTATNLSADELDGKDFSDFYAQGSKVADSANADQADQATSASSAADADTLDGTDSSEFLSTDQRLTTDNVAQAAGTITLDFESIGAQSCTDRTVSAGTDLSNDVVAVTLGSNELLPLSFYTAGSASNSDAFRLMVCNLTTASYDPPSSTYRWVAFDQPCADCEQIAEWEATAQSDLRNAATAAEVCAADNGGSYDNCGTLASLEAYGFNKSPDVNYTNVQATATRWVSTTQNVNGGSAYKYDSADGKIVPIPRGSS
jgi:hypothetical protein